MLLAMFAALALALSVTIPLGEAPDEVSHFAFVQQLVERHRLPEREGAAAGEAHQPPLYYLLGAAATFWIPEQRLNVIANPDWGNDNPDVPNLLLHTRQEGFPYNGTTLAWHIVRLLSILFGVATVWATWRIGHTVFPGDSATALLAASLVAFLPQFTFLSSVVNNDNLVITLSALSLLCFLRLCQEPRLNRAVMVGILLGLATLAKISAFTLWVAIALAILFGKGNAQIGSRLKQFAQIFLAAGIVLVPWLVYNTLAYGDPLSLSRLLGSTPRTDPMTLADWITYGVRLYLSFWGRFGGVTNVGMAGMFYVVLTVLFTVGMIGIVFLVRDWHTGNTPATTRQAVMTLAIYWACLITAHVWLTLSVLGMDQARQLFAGLPSLSVMVAAGVLRLTREHRLSLAFSLSVSLVVIGLLNWQGISAVYFLSAQTAAPSSSLESSDFGQIIRVLDYRIPRTEVVPGDSLAVQFDWQALSDPVESYWLLLQLADTNDVVVNREGTPAAGRVTTDYWQVGQTYRSNHTLVVPADVSPGTYTLRMGLHPFGTWNWLPVSGKEMLALGRITVKSSQR